MAQLWVATNEATGAEVCVKLLVPQRSDDESVERFRREAYAAARLSHRAIVKIFDLVELGSSGETTTSAAPAALAIVMELLHGETLGDLLMKRGKLPLEEAIDLVIPFLSALAHAHRAGVVHRDLKPDNIFLARDPDGHVIPKVLDFGVSKMAAETGRRSQSPGPPPVTQDGVMLGTPSFMSPEQARGSRQVDARSDVFSAGILVYMMLAGNNPFESEQFHSVLSAIMQRDPPQPAGVPDEIWEVVSRCLAKDPEARFADATELGIALRRASGRTSTTDSGPQSRIPTMPKEMAVPLGGDSIVTVPPVSGEELPDESEHAAHASGMSPVQRGRVTIVATVFAVAGVIAVVALMRGGREPEREKRAGAAAGGAASIASVETSASASASAPSTSTSTSVTAEPDAGVKKGRAPGKRRDPRAEPSSVRDPGF